MINLCLLISVGFECTFDQNMCGWQQNTHSKFKWSRQRGLKIGPSSDHTGGLLKTDLLILNKKSSSDVDQNRQALSKSLTPITFAPTKPW